MCVKILKKEKFRELAQRRILKSRFQNLSVEKILKADFCDLRAGEILKGRFLKACESANLKGAFTLRLVSCTARPLPALLYFAPPRFLRRAHGPLHFCVADTASHRV